MVLTEISLGPMPESEDSVGYFPLRAALHSNKEHEYWTSGCCAGQGLTESLPLIRRYMSNTNSSILHNKLSEKQRATRRQTAAIWNAAFGAHAREGTVPNDWPPCLALFQDTPQASNVEVK